MGTVPSAHRPILRERAINWLISSDGPILPDGNVLSWVNRNHEGYPYPEAAAWLLLFLIEEDAPVALRARIALALERSVSSNGSCGREGRGYLFDSAIVYAALQRHLSSGCQLADASVLPRLLDFVSRRVRLTQPVWPGGGLVGAWSAQFGSQLLMVAGILAAAGEKVLATSMFDDLIRLEYSGRFRNHARTDATYLLAHCYAVQGLLMLGRCGFNQANEIAQRSAKWLAEVQTHDGGIPARYQAGQTTGAWRGDATAQAVRIWNAVDRGAFAGSIAQGESFLARLQTESGGLRYELESNDVNTWVTTFAVQALLGGIINKVG